MRARIAVALGCLTLLAGCAAPPPRANAAEPQRQVADTERAFAKTMADRDHAAFATFLSEEAVFFTGPQPLVGKAPVAAAWKFL
jgi:ketosteroid isomerase-like protein